MSTPEHDVHGLVAAYALHALTPEEHDRVRRHLRECADCRRDLREFRETTVRMAYAESERPPDRIWERLREALPAVRQLPPETTGQRFEADASTAPTMEEWASLTPTPLRRRRAPWAPWLVAAACLAVAVGLGGVAAAQHARMTEMAEHTAKVEALLAASDTRMSESPVPGSEAHATVFASNEYDMVMVVVTGLPPTPEEMGYQLWYIDGDDEMRPAGMLHPSDDGEMLTAMAPDLDDAEQIGITMEPAEGMPRPSDEPMKVDV